MDAAGKAITPIVTHQDRRSIEIARALEARVGKERHLQLAGNRPFPGGISSTTCAWFLAHEPETMKKADLVGHLNTYLHRQMTGARVIDPSNASFSGLYSTCDQSGWNDELCAAVGVSRAALPEVVESDVIAGHVTAAAAGEFGLRAGTPVITGMVDTSAAMLVTGCGEGQLFHMCASTDVLGVASDAAHPHERLLTRAVGIGKKWMSVSTIAAAGSSLDWVRGQFFREMSDEQYHQLIADMVASPRHTEVRFEPYLAGERTSIEQRQAVFSGLTLGSTREDLLASVMAALSTASAARLALLAAVQKTFLEAGYVSGGAGALADLMHREWKGTWRFHYLAEAGLAGLAMIEPRGR
jgi:xylulokinase